MSRQTAARRRPPDPDPSHFGPAGRTWEVGAEPHLDLAVNTDVGSARRRGRGAQTNASGRFEPRVLVAFDDGWQSIEDLPPFKTEVAIDTARKVITRNTSPDIPFDRSINPYRGCEHGCIYCFARPTHAYLGLSPGLDFESRIFVKEDARKLQITRHVLEVLRDFRHPVGVVTKSALVARDIDILADMARDHLATVAI